MLSLSLSCCPPLPCLRVGRKGEIALAEHTFQDGCARGVCGNARCTAIGLYGFFAGTSRLLSPPRPPAAMHSHPTPP